MAITSMVIGCLAYYAMVAQGARPVFSNLPVTLYVGEDETANRVIHFVTVADPEGTEVSCDIKSVTSKTTSSAGNCQGADICADGDEFTLLRNPETGIHELDITGNPWVVGWFDDEENPYFVTIVCQDGDTEKRTSTATILVEDDQDVQWGIPLPETVTFNAQTTVAGTRLTTIHANNSLDVPMLYYLVNTSPDQPGTDPYFAVDPNTGDITTLQDLYNIPLDYGRTFYIDVRAEDADGKLEIFGRIRLKLTKQNIRPVTYNLPKTATLSEHTPLGTTLFSLNIINPEADQNVTTTWNCDPDSGNTVFTLDANNKFKLASELNFHTDPYYACTFVLNDGYHDNLFTYTYELTVTNANDPPEFDSAEYQAIFYEGLAGQTSVDPELVCSDVDSGVTYALKDAGNSHRYSLDPNTGVLTFAADYDVDGSSGWSTSEKLTVYCIDDGYPTGTKLTATAEIAVTIIDANDNTPEFPFKSYTWYSDNTMTPGSTVIGKLVPTDADSGTNAEVTCSATSADGFSSYYTMSSACELYLSKAIDFESGIRVRYIVLATDKGSPKRTGTATIDVISRDFSTTTTSTTAVTTTAYDFWDHGGSIAVFLFTLLGGLALLGLGLYVCLRCCMFGWVNMWPRFECCQTRYRYPSRRQVTPESPPKTPQSQKREKSPYSRPTRVMVRRAVVQPDIYPVRPMQSGPFVMGNPPGFIAAPPYPS